MILSFGRRKEKGHALFRHYASQRTTFILILHNKNDIVNKNLKIIFRGLHKKKKFSISHKKTFPVFGTLTKVAPYP